MKITICHLAGLAAVVLTGCAGLPPGLSPDPRDSDGMLISVPGVGGAPARIERIDAPDNSWRRQKPSPQSPPPITPSTMANQDAPSWPAPAGEKRQLQSALELPQALDIVAKALPRYFDGAPSGGLLDALAAGPPPAIDGRSFPVSVSLQPLSCKPIPDRYFAEVMRHVCRDGGGRFDMVSFALNIDFTGSNSDDLARYHARTAAGFNFALIRQRLLAAGITELRPVRPAEPYSHIPIPEDFTLFAPPGTGPVVVLQHGRGDSIQFVRTMTVYLPVR